MSFIEWFEMFVEEKELPVVSWNLENNDGVHNFIDSEVVIEYIKMAPKHEQEAIRDVIVKIDFANGDVNDFFKHLAGAIINQ